MKRITIIVVAVIAVSMALLADPPTTNYPVLKYDPTTGNLVPATTNGHSIGGSGSSLPSQTGNGSSLLTTDGSSATWSIGPVLGRSGSAGSLGLKASNGNLTTLMGNSSGSNPNITFPSNNGTLALFGDIPTNLNQLATRNLSDLQSVNMGLLFGNFARFQPGGTFNDGKERGLLFFSYDGKTMASVPGLENYSPPNDGTHARGVRDAAPIKIGNNYFVAYSTSGSTGSGFGLNSAGIAKSSDLINWTFVTNVVPSSGWFNNPRWFVDPANGNRWLMGNDGGAATIFLFQNTDSNGYVYTNELDPLVDNASANIIGRDISIAYNSGTYYLFVYNISDFKYYYYTNTSIRRTGWVSQGLVNNFPTDNREGLAVAQLANGTFIAYISGANNVDLGTQMYYMTSSDLVAWTTPAPINQIDKKTIAYVSWNSGGAFIISDPQTHSDLKAAMLQYVPRQNPFSAPFILRTQGVAPFTYIGADLANDNNIIAFNATTTSTTPPSNITGIQGGDASGKLFLNAQDAGFEFRDVSHGSLATIQGISSGVSFNAFGTNKSVTLSPTGTGAIISKGPFTLSLPFVSSTFDLISLGGHSGLILKVGNDAANQSAFGIQLADIFNSSTYTYGPIFSPEGLSIGTGSATSIVGLDVSGNVKISGLTASQFVETDSSKTLVSKSASTFRTDLGLGTAATANTGTGASNVPLGGTITAGGPTGSSSLVPVITYNAAGQLTAVTTAAITVPTVATTASVLKGDNAGNAVAATAGTDFSGLASTNTHTAGLNTFNAGVTVSGSALTLSGNQSAAAWTTNGLRIKGVTGTLTDTTSATGTVAAAYTDKLGGNTIAATNTGVIFTEYASLKLSDPVAGTNVTFTKKYSLDADSALITALTIGSGSPITSSGPGGALGTGAFAASFDPTAPGAIGGTTPSTGAFTSLALTLASTLTLAPAANTASTGWLLTDTTAASAGNQQYSPAVRWTGQGWKTNTTAASEAVDFRAYVKPVQGAADPTGTWTLESSVNGGTWGSALTYNTSGQLLLNGGAANPSSPLVSAPGSTSSSSAEFGSFGLQSYAVNNCWLADNGYYNAGFQARATGYSTFLNFLGANGFEFFMSTGSASAGPITPPTTRGKLLPNGAFGFGGTINHNDATTTGATISGDTSGNVGFAAGKLVGWSSTSDSSAAKDIALTRNAAGVVEVNNGTAGTLRDLKLRHLIGGSTAPTIANGAGAGTSPGTPTIAGSDMAGQITIITGTLPSISSVAVTVTFNAAYGTAPYVVIWPANANAATLGFLPYVGSTTTTFTVNTGTIALGASTTYLYNYVVMQ